MAFDYIPCRIPEHIVPAIINGDTSGLDSREDAALRRFEARIHAAATQAGAIGPGHWANDPDYPEEVETGEYSFYWDGDDILGVAGNIAHLAYMFPTAE
jgi:hypothetical protein